MLTPLHDIHYGIDVPYGDAMTFCWVNPIAAISFSKKCLVKKSWMNGTAPATNYRYKTRKVSRLNIRDESGAAMKLNGPNIIYIKGDYLYFTEFNTNSVYKMKL